MPAFGLPTEDDNLRQALFTVCETREHLHDWVKLFLGLDLPDCIVCDDDVGHPPSNSSPMDLLWELYQKALDGHDESFTQVLVYAARDSYKTIVASVFETLALFHLKRNPFHVAAIESQAKRATYYIQKYLKRPILRDYIVSKNQRVIEVAWYENASGDRLTPKKYDELTDAERAPWFEERYKIEILVATLNSLNSGHSSLLVEDELDLVPPTPLEEAKMIPAEGEVNRELPITLMISSRKFARGPIQDILDDSEYGGQVRHWNIIDVTKACPPERHLPEEPRIPIYFSESRLSAVSVEEFGQLDPKAKSEFQLQEGYAGCLKNCKLFSVCRGRLATKQRSTSRLLKSVRTVQATFRSLKNIDVAKSQLMGWKPSGEGMVYPTFDPALHMLSAAQIAALITGETHPESMTKQELIGLAKSRGAEFFSGMDFGYTHCFAVVVGFRWGSQFFVLDVIEIPELTPSQQIDICRPYHESLEPAWYADTAYPGSIKDFRRSGFRMVDWQKKPNSVVDGIRVVQSMLTPVLGAPPTLYFLRGDEGCELLAKRIAKYHWKLDSDGRPTAVPDDVEDDLCDALRYVLMNLFSPRGSIVVPEVSQGTTVVGSPEQQAAAQLDPTAYTPGQAPTVNNYLSYYINESLGSAPDVGTNQARGKKGRIYWSMD